MQINRHDYQHYMNIAINLAYRNIGRVAPNPSVGCVIVKNNQIVAAAVTEVGGRPHAETIALQMAGKQAKGASLFVTLEPCCHTGKTPPCTDAIIAAGIKEVFIAIKDPYPKVNGRGIEQLQAAGIKVDVGLLEEKAKEVTAGFLKNQLDGMPYVTLKVATSMDGKIASRTGNSQWITGKEARDYAHLLRAKNDAILVGIGTVEADDPSLTCRLPGLEGASPIRVVLDSKLKISPKANLIKTAGEVPTLVMTAKKSGPQALPVAPLGKMDVGHRQSLRPAVLSPEIIVCKKDKAGHVDLKDVLKKLAAMGINSLLVEGGSKVASAFLKQKLVDKLVWARAPIILGNDALPAVGDCSIDVISKAINLKKIRSFNLGKDLVEEFLPISGVIVSK